MEVFNYRHLTDTPSMVRGEYFFSRTEKLRSMFQDLQDFAMQVVKWALRIGEIVRRAKEESICGQGYCTCANEKNSHC
jgi:hypothetical protein